MFQILLYSIQDSIVPKPKAVQDSWQFLHVTPLEFSCEDSKGAKTCPEHVAKNFAYFQKLMFQRDAPYTKEEYASKNINETISSVKLILQDVSNNVDIQEVNESYSISFTSEVVINAASPMASARAFASLTQYVTLSNVNESDRKMYIMGKTTIQDAPHYKWRQYQADACAHFMTLDDIKRIIDANSLQKLNVLLLTLTCAHSFPLAFQQKPQNRLVFGSWTPYHYYDKADMLELQQYAQMRGVVIVPEVRMPSHAFSWRHADPKLVADCPALAAQNPNNVPLNPLYERTMDYVKGAISETIEGFFPSSLNIRPYIHLGGHAVNFECMKQDRAISNVILNSPGLTYEKIWRDFHQNILTYVEQLKSSPIVIFDEGALLNDNVFNKNTTLVHFTISTQKQKANHNQIKQIHSSGLDLGLMHPNGGHHYFWQDTWMDLQRQDIQQGSENNLTIGGGCFQTSNNCYAQSCEQHAFDRALGAGENLWTGTVSAWGDSTRMQQLGCRMDHAGIGTGPLEIGQPCLGQVRD
ncbi:Beta-N-acetylhexosaminidase [Hexamita inflata]|uniref:beta-N-acetylhexosaminidase n=1 Tax=Hexamita inflata TaxID=28002 RepID=A0AA86PB96_9EUKA|nr:Beta-N-acetylhexosaminidase [Hexamita inflata]